jgi:hypothetical protein
MNTITQNNHPQKTYNWPACIGVEEAAVILGWPLYFFTVLIRAGHLKPHEQPAVTASAP